MSKLTESEVLDLKSGISPRSIVFKLANEWSNLRAENERLKEALRYVEKELKIAIENQHAEFVGDILLAIGDALRGENDHNT